MNASIVDLRYRTAEVLAALDRGERVLVLYRGKPRATIVPLPRAARMRAAQHPFFGLNREERESIASVMARLRGARHAV
jgi:antitoxin (DNA-binding transcriptional repressor) of toxin-antitoxin stability system